MTNNVMSQMFLLFDCREELKSEVPTIADVNAVDGAKAWYRLGLIAIDANNMIVTAAKK